MHKCELFIEGKRVGLVSEVRLPELDPPPLEQEWPGVVRTYLTVTRPEVQKGQSTKVKRYKDTKPRW